MSSNAPAANAVLMGKSVMTITKVGLDICTTFDVLWQTRLIFRTSSQLSSLMISIFLVITAANLGKKTAIGNFALFERFDRLLTFDV
jgi:hypothetical protein